MAVEIAVLGVPVAASGPLLALEEELSPLWAEVTSVIISVITAVTPATTVQKATER
jgi:hypothetical protein